MEFGVQVADIAEGNLKINYDLGELKLGKLDKEYFNDPDLHSILQGTELDTTAMERVENEKLYLIYSVIYSERFELEGKRQSEVMTKLHNVMFRFNAPLPTSAPFQKSAPAPITISASFQQARPIPISAPFQQASPIPISAPFQQVSPISISAPSNKLPQFQ